MRKFTVLVADDHAIVKEGLVTLLKEHDFDVVGAVGDGQELLESARRLRPDRDRHRPLDAGPERPRRADPAEGRAHRQQGDRADDAPRRDLATRAMRAGACAFLLKHSAGEELLTAIQQALEGRIYLTPTLTREVIERMASPSESASPQLTPRQLDVLRLILEGRRMKEIAAAPQPVRAHRRDAQVSDDGHPRCGLHGRAGQVRRSSIG